MNTDENDELAEFRLEAEDADRRATDHAAEADRLSAELNRLRAGIKALAHAWTNMETRLVPLMSTADQRRRCADDLRALLREDS